MPKTEGELRASVRELVRQEVEAGRIIPQSNSWSIHDAAFSRRLGQAGFLGMTWPRRYGGHERSTLERYVVVEELLAAGAPVGAHWVADRQSGYQILHHGSERARAEILPRIAAGECFFGIGMSEPDSGSDLAAVRSRARKTADGWRISGSKIWTSGAHHAHYLIALLRTGGPEAQRQGGLTQFIIDTRQSGIEIRPIYNLYGGHDFNQITFDDCWVPDDMMIGQEGSGWDRVTGELAFERSGPDRFLTTFPLLTKALTALSDSAQCAQAGQLADQDAAQIGRMLSHLMALRTMSGSIAGMLEQGEQPLVEAALVKDLGTAFEREIPERLRSLLPLEAMLGDERSLAHQWGMTMLQAPSFTLRGGTREILRGMIARGLGLG
ncbi:MAG: acyl-CoA dehydrogenase, partial [Betaproteobacteria bacterium]|nr:acyl-CoA dehydrogenase [Betaproteobacteria bacterium]